MWKKQLLSGIKRNCRRDRNCFALCLSNLIPSWIDISLLKITSKHLTGFEMAEVQLHFEVRFEMVNAVTYL